MQRLTAAPEGPKRSDGLPEALEFTLDLWALVHSLNARSEWMHRTYGVTGSQRMLARVIGLWPACSPGDAARLLRLHPEQSFASWTLWSASAWHAEHATAVMRDASRADPHATREKNRCHPERHSRASG